MRGIKEKDKKKDSGKKEKEGMKNLKRTNLVRVEWGFWKCLKEFFKVVYSIYVCVYSKEGRESKRMGDYIVANS